MVYTYLFNSRVFVNEWEIDVYGQFFLLALFFPSSVRETLAFSSRRVNNIFHSFGKSASIYSTDYRHAKRGTVTRDKFNKRDLPPDNSFFLMICESSGIVPKYLSHYTIKYNKPRKSVDVGKQSIGFLRSQRAKRLRQEKYKS